MTLTLAQRQTYARYAGALLIVMIAALALRPEPKVRPWLVQAAGEGYRIPWTDSLRAQWTDVMQCVGLDPTPDPTLELWIVPASAPSVPVPGTALDWYRGWYDATVHAAVVREREDPAEQHAALNHELVHARQRTAHGPHELIFEQYATECGLAVTSEVTK